MTTGESFGGDFLLYPGDPIYFHASHIVCVLPEGSSSIGALHLIGKCRLAVVVKKKMCFAYESDGDIHIEMVDWINPKLKDNQNTVVDS